MVISNNVGSSEKLGQICRLVGTSDLSLQLSEVDREEFENLALNGAVAHMLFMPNAAGCYGVYVGKRLDLANGRGLCLGFLNVYEEGPHYAIPLHYLKAVAEEELEAVRAKAGEA